MKVVLVLARQSRQVGAPDRKFAQSQNGSAEVTQEVVALRETAHSALQAPLGDCPRTNFACPGQNEEEREEMHCLRGEECNFCQSYMYI